MSNNKTNITCKRNIKGRIGLVLAVMATTPVRAENFSPHLEGEAAVEFAGNIVQNRNKSHEDMNPKVEIAAQWLLTPALSVQGGIYAGNIL